MVLGNREKYVRSVPGIALVSASASAAACVREQKLKLGQNSDEALILHMCIPCDEILFVVPYFLSCDLDL